MTVARYQINKIGTVYMVLWFMSRTLLS